MKTRFFTGRGDDGNSRVGSKSYPKDHALLVALGTLDELNAMLGWCRAVSFPGEGPVNVREALQAFQEQLFVVQAEVGAVAFPGETPFRATTGPETLIVLEGLIDRVDEVVPKLTAFVVPGGTELASRLEIARTVARRAERALAQANHGTPLPKGTLQYLNRLSSALFALSRYENHRSGVGETNPKY